MEQEYNKNMREEDSESSLSSEKESIPTAESNQVLNEIKLGGNEQLSNAMTQPDKRSISHGTEETGFSTGTDECASSTSSLKGNLPINAGPPSEQNAKTLMQSSSSNLEPEQLESAFPAVNESEHEGLNEINEVWPSTHSRTRDMPELGELLNAHELPANPSGARGIVSSRISQFPVHDIFPIISTRNFGNSERLNPRVTHRTRTEPYFCNLSLSSDIIIPDEFQVNQWLSTLHREYEARQLPNRGMRIGIAPVTLNVIFAHPLTTGTSVINFEVQRNPASLGTHDFFATAVITTTVRIPLSSEQTFRAMVRTAFQYIMEHQRQFRLVSESIIMIPNSVDDSSTSHGI